ncbi:MAG: YjgP/YjgQ family permease, partial [Spirochaetaceae bacterium]
MRSKYRASNTILFYIAKEFLLTFLVSFLVFFAIFFINQILVLAGDILQKNAPIQDVLRLMLYAMPSFVALSIPFATLVGALLSMGKFSNDNEIIAFQASGVPLGMLFAPMIALGITFAGGSFIVNDILLPVGTLNYAQLYTSLILRNPELELESYSVQAHRKRVIITGQVDDRSIDTLLIIDDDSEGNRRIITGSDAKLLAQEEESTDLSLSLSNVFSHSYSGDSNPSSWDYASGEQMVYRVPLEDITEAVTRPGPHQMSSVDVHAFIKKREEELQEKRQTHRESYLNL